MRISSETDEISFKTLKEANLRYCLSFVLERNVRDSKNKPHRAHSCLELNETLVRALSECSFALGGYWSESGGMIQMLICYVSLCCDEVRL